MVLFTQQQEMGVIMKLTGCFGGDCSILHSGSSDVDEPNKLPLAVIIRSFVPNKLPPAVTRVSADPNKPPLVVIVADAQD